MEGARWARQRGRSSRRPLPASGTKLFTSQRTAGLRHCWAFCLCRARPLGIQLGLPSFRAAHKAHGSIWRPVGAGEPCKPLAPSQKGGEEEVEEKKGERCPRQAHFRK